MVVLPAKKQAAAALLFACIVSKSSFLETVPARDAVQSLVMCLQEQMTGIVPESSSLPFEVAASAYLIYLSLVLKTWKRCRAVLGAKGVPGLAGAEGCTVSDVWPDSQLLLGLFRKRLDLAADVSLPTSQPREFSAPASGSASVPTAPWVACLNGRALVVTNLARNRSNPSRTHPPL